MENLQNVYIGIKISKIKKKHRERSNLYKKEKFIQKTLLFIAFEKNFTLHSKF